MLNYIIFEYLFIILLELINFNYLQECTELKLAFHGRKVKKFERPTLEIEGIVATTGLTSLITCLLETGNMGLLFAFAYR